MTTRWIGCVLVLALGGPACGAAPRPYPDPFYRCIFQDDCAEARARCVEGDAATCRGIGLAWAAIQCHDDDPNLPGWRSMGEEYLFRS